MRPGPQENFAAGGGNEIVIGSDGDFIINTGDWLGWLELTYRPWIWGWSINNWIYISGNVAEVGCGWIYFPRSF